MKNLILDCCTLLHFEQFVVYIERNQNRMMVTELTEENGFYLFKLEKKDLNL